MLECPAILVADDNDDDIELLRRSFAKAGFAKQFIAVSGGQAVIHYLKGEGVYADREQFPLPRLVLLDFKMQGITGAEVLQWIRQRPEFKGMPVIVFTGSNYEEDVNRAYDLGANSYLIKPQTLDDLLVAVRQIGDFWLRLSQLPDRPSLRPS
jgi:CheY-like chemotaxis protein